MTAREGNMAESWPSACLLMDREAVVVPNYAKKTHSKEHVPIFLCQAAGLLESVIFYPRT